MRILLILAVTKILEASRFHLNAASVPRSYYDLLSLALVGAILAFFILDTKTSTDGLEARLERIFASRRVLAYALDVLLAVVLLYETWRYADLLYLYPIRCNRADMLPIVRGAAEYLSAFSNPFDKTYCPWNVPFVYLPMMMLYYLPAILLKFDMRFISHLSLLLTLFLVYGHQRKHGRPLAGFLIVWIMASSGLFRFYIMTVQDFPFLLVIALALFSFYEKKDEAFFFCLALALATRQVFLVLFPIFAIAALKTRRLRPRGLAAFGAGLLFGFLPALLYPRSFILNFVRSFRHYSHAQGNGLFLTHSLGFSHYFFDRKTIATILCLCLLGALYLLALKYLRESNLWLFLALGLADFLFFTRYGLRPEEYYYLPLFAILSVMPLRRDPGAPSVPFRRSLQSLAMGACVLILFTFPLLAKRSSMPFQIRDAGDSKLFGRLEGTGRMEFSLAVAAPRLRQQTLAFEVRVRDPRPKAPLLVSVLINDKPVLSRELLGSWIRIELDRDVQRKYLIWGSNAFEVSLNRPEPFQLKVIREPGGH